MAKYLNMAALGKHGVMNLRTILARQHSSVAKSVDVSVNDKTGIATVSMNKPPVNSLNLDLITELIQNIRELEEIKCRGIILTSALPKVFSAGVDILEIYKPNMERFDTFWRSFQELWLTLYGTGLPTAAAINGASPAGGCVLAMCCEYRVFAEGKHRIGLNETKLGLVVPKWLQDTVIIVTGHRQAEISLFQGSLYAPEDALRIGLVDELATDKEDAIAKCEKYILSCAKISSEARSAVKLQVRKPTMTWLEENRDLDTKKMFTLLEEPWLQKTLEIYMQAMKKK